MKHKISLLDINVLIALAWPSHIHYQEAHHWFQKYSHQGWATCPITESGFLRISCNPAIIKEAVTPTEALMVLSQITQLRGHVFWEDRISFTNTNIPTQFLVGYRQFTDAYLIGLAKAHKGQLVTMDSKIASMLPKKSAWLDALHVITT